MARAIEIVKSLRRRISGKLSLLWFKATLKDIETGPGFFCAKGVHITRKHKVRAGKNLFLGRYVHIASNIKFGDNVLVASFVGFVGGDHRFENIGSTPMNEAGVQDFKQTIIGDNVWIGHGAIILVGVKIGNGAVIAAGSIVTKDVDSDAIVAGNYASLKRYRNN